ncbi:MAG: hypothetical protein ACRESG_09365, partial [Gammaproteobacteria bacterium]
SRHRQELHVYSDKASLEQLAPDWAKSHQKDVTLDYTPVKQEARREESGALEKKSGEELGL